jgi:hypothetical protein
VSIGPAIPATSPLENSARTPANPGTATGAGDEFVYIPETGPGYEFPVNIAWDVTFTGGTFTTLSVILEGSDDGVNWFTISTAPLTAAGRQVVSNTVPRMMRANIQTFTVASGSPVVVVGITA